MEKRFFFQLANMADAAAHGRRMGCNADEEKHLASNGVYKPEIASAIANLSLRMGARVLRASCWRIQILRRPPTASADAKERGVC